MDFYTAVLVHKQHPQRPDEPAFSMGLSNDVWEIMVDCWKFNPDNCPDMAKVVRRLEGIMQYPPAPVHKGYFHRPLAILVSTF